MSKNFEKEYNELISRAKKILGNCDAIDTNVKEAIEAIFPMLKKDKTDDQKWKILKSMIHANVPDNIYSYYRLGRKDFEVWVDDKSKEISVLKDQIESLTAELKLFCESKYKPVISREVIREGIAHFGITQHQIDNWLKKYFNIIDQGPCEDCKHPMLNCHNFPCYEVTKPGQLNEQEKVNCNARLEFHEGDWVVKGNVIAQILDVQEQYYIGLDTDGNDFTVSRFLSDDKIHLWTITDAKEGDVLAINWQEGDDSWEKIIIFKKYHNKGVEGLVNTPCVEGYGNTFKNGKLAINEKVPYFSKAWTDNLHPATKEQRNTLIKAIVGSGYTFDFEKKELKKIEPKTLNAADVIEWLKPYECVVDDIVEQFKTFFKQ